MRDDNGVYLGRNVCLFWGGVDHMAEAECCGGRRYMAAWVRCSMRGVIPAGSCSNKACEEWKAYNGVVEVPRERRGG